MTDPPISKDLTSIGSDGGNVGRSSASVGPVIEKNYDLVQDRETKRGTIALALVWTLVGVIGSVVLIGAVTAYGCHVKDACSDATTDLKTLRVVIEIILTPLVGLVGAVTGFYFGEKSAAEKRSQ